MKEELDNLVQRSHSTYKSRLIASERLASRNVSWNTSLVALSSALVVASIGLLENENMYGSQGATVLASISVLSLSVSLVVAGRNYGARSRDMFANYRRIQRLCVEAELLALSKAVKPSEIKAISDRYQSLLDESENHVSSDYFKSLKRKAKNNDGTKKPLSHKFQLLSTLHVKTSDEQSNSKVKFKYDGGWDSILSALPFVFLIIPISVLVPFFKWIVSG